MAGWNAEMNACPEADSFMVELRIDVFVYMEMTKNIDKVEEMIGKLRENIETSWKAQEGRLKKTEQQIDHHKRVWSRRFDKKC